MVVDFRPSRPLRPEDVRDEAMLERILDLVKRTHHDAFRHVRGPICAFWPFRICRDYAFYLEDNNSRMITKLPIIREHNERLETAVGAIDLVLGHSDMLVENFLDSGERLWLIDWEHAGFTSPLFDLANLASNNELSEAQQGWLLESYFEKPLTDDLWCRFLAMSAASLLREAMWSMVSEIQSTVDFDYVAYSDEFYDRFNRAIRRLKEYR